MSAVEVAAGNKAIIAVLSACLLSSCGMLGIKPNVRVEMVETGAPASRVARSVISQSEELYGVYFSNLDIYAYQFNDSEVNESAKIRHFLLTPHYVEKMCNLFLEASGTIDVTALDTPMHPDLAQFRVDILRVTANYPGVVLGKVFYGPNHALISPTEGMGDRHPLFLYPEYDWIPTEPAFAELEGSGMSVDRSDHRIVILFARSDWFPEPVIVGVRDEVTPRKTDGDWSSKDLTDAQWARIKSATGGIVAVVPYGEVKTVDTSNLFKTTLIRVEMNFETLLSDASYEDWQDDGHFSPSPDWPLGPGRFFLRVVDDVPFGAKLSIAE